METQTNVQLDVRPLPNLERAIALWLAARDAYKMHPSDERRHVYNAAWFTLGAEWAVRYPEAADTLGAFAWFRRGLVAPDEAREAICSLPYSPGASDRDIMKRLCKVLQSEEDSKFAEWEIEAEKLIKQYALEIAACSRRLAKETSSERSRVAHANRTRGYSRWKEQ